MGDISLDLMVDRRHPLLEGEKPFPGPMVKMV